ncbi:MAG: NAD(P)H-hydrate dehydratase [Clostridia bacterium]|nr:NAD(P)H-hydrate dehydratase [Clostridia bacterium]
MLKACYAEEMRNLDRAATEIGKIPSILLMENAALACVNELKKDFDVSKCSVAIFCGKGNNGGDGLAIARHLYNAGVKVNIFLVSGNDFSGDAKINYDIVNAMDVPVDTVTDTEDFEYVIRSYDIVIDAILGTGISGDVRGLIFDVIRLINENARYVMAVDVPSGINSDSGEICGICINADKTVTFAAYKTGMFMYPAADSVGEVVVAPISIPKTVVNSQNLQINVTDADFVRNVIPGRSNNSQKGDYGKLLIIAGSKGMTGAAYLAAESALKSGAGLITLACPESINTVLESKTTEVMTLPVADNNGHISYLASSVLTAKANEADAVLIGPGLGRSEDVLEIVKVLLKECDVPVIVDADALFAVANDKDMLKDASCDLVFTPHAMEMARLTGLDISYIEENRIDISREYSEETGVVLLLKGHHSIVTAPSLLQYINNTGNPGMASGGSGDVLAGIVSALVARGIRIDYAAAAAAYIHGLAGDIAKEYYGEESLSAENILECIPEAYCRILQVDK